MDYSTSTIEQLNKVVSEIKRIADAQSQVEFWYDKKWAIALFGALIGVISVTILDLLRKKIRKREHIKIMVKNLFSEIILNRENNNHLLPDTKNNLKDFINMLNGKFDGKPSVMNTDMVIKDYYQTYLKDLGLLNDSLRTKIIIFYTYLRSEDSSSKKLEIMFEKFYNPENKMIGKEDIIKSYKKMIRQMEIIDLLGAEALAGIINFYRIDKPIDNKGFRKKEKEILNHLKKIKVNEIISVKEIAEKTQTSIVFVNTVLLKIKGMENVKYGKYKKIISK